MLTELGHELWIGDAAEIRAANVGHQKTDIRDARLILQLLGDQRRRGARVAQVAVARKLAVRLYGMLRTFEAEAQRVGTQGRPLSVMARATTPPNS
ncbi:MAG: hypothetical protein WB869_06335 [Candidatus Acidiferrales bacterium]